MNHIAGPRPVISDDEMGAVRVLMHMRQHPPPLRRASPPASSLHEIMLSVMQPPKSYDIFPPLRRVHRPNHTVTSNTNPTMSQVDTALTLPSIEFDEHPPHVNGFRPLPVETPSDGSLTDNQPSPCHNVSTETTSHITGPPVPRTPRKTSLRTSQPFDPFSIDSGSPGSPKAIPTTTRFCKNLAHHFKARSGDSGWQFEDLELHTCHFTRRTTEGLEVLRDDSDTAIDNHANVGVIREVEAAGSALLAVERELCRYLNLRHDKYRCIKARLLFGFACIVEQNFRGCSGKLRACHPVLQKSDKYQSVNVGAAQAQLLCKGLDVNITSRVYNQFQAWEWLPTEDILQLQHNVAVVAPAVEKLFPHELRCQVLQLAVDWDIGLNLPTENRMLICDDDLLVDGLFFGSRACICSSALPSVTCHPVINQYSLPQRPKAPKPAPQKRRRGSAQRGTSVHASE